MEEDDEFGDLYADVLLPPSSAHPELSLFGSSTPAPSAASKPATAAPNSLLESDGDEGDDRSCSGAPSSGRGPSPEPPSQPLARPTLPVSQDGGGDDWILGPSAAPEEQTLDWGDEEDEGLARVSGSRELDLPLEPEEFRVSSDEGEKEVVPGVLELPREETEQDGQGFVVSDDVGASMAEGKGTEMTEIGDGVADLDQEPVIPGLSAASGAPSALGSMNGDDEIVSRSEDLDSDSEDDLQIVLNNNSIGPFGASGKRVVGVEDEDDEDGEEDLVIVTDEDQQHHHQVMEEQEWGDELMQQPLDGERNETLDMSKGNSGIGITVGTRIAYNSHGFHGQHHSQFKYIRPGAAAMPGGATAGSGSAPGQVRPPLNMGPMVGRTRGVQKGFHSGHGMPLWASSASARAYGSGLDFTLPSHKTIFDIDIDGFEEKPWRLPGVDISDFFNFGLDGDSWRNYRKQLEQLRLEATMQSKIRVYESGRSERDYDPDLPPELAAATGAQDIYAESTQLGKRDGGQTDLVGPGRGLVRSQQQLPTGRAIQVEGGYGERLPSIDTRPPRIRDSDAIIEIVPQDPVDETVTSNGPLDRRLYENQRQDFRGDHRAEDYERGIGSEYFDHSPPAYSGRKREVINRKGPFVGSADISIPQGNGILPSPSDVSLNYRSNSRSRSPVYVGDHYGVTHGARWKKVSSPERFSHVSDQHSIDTISQQSDKLQVGVIQKEKSGAGIEVKGDLQVSPTAPLETSKEVNLEEGGGEQNDRLAMGDGTEVEDKETVSNLQLSGETNGDSCSDHATKKQKLTSQVEQPAFHGDGVDSGVSHSENSKARSGSSRDFSKRREGGEEEVMQRGQTRQIQNLEGHHDEEKQSSQRKDDRGQDGTCDMDRCRITSKGREDIYHSHQHLEPHSGNYERRSKDVEKLKERDDSVGVRQRREDDAYGRRGKDGDTKRDHDEEMGSRHKNKVMVTEKKGKGEDLHSRKHIDDGDWKGRHHRVGTPRQRDKDDNLTNRRETFDDLHVKRKKDEEQRRREKVSKDDTQHGYRGREDVTHSKRDRDEGIDHRRREDQARVRDKPANHHSIRHRDDNWRQREREDRQRLKQPHEDSQKLKEREEGRSIIRSGRVLEDKNASGGGRDNVYPPKDTRRHGEQHRRVDREEHTRAEHEVREEMHTREHQLSRREKNPRRERLSSHIDHPLTADGEKMYKELHKESSRKGKEIEARVPQKRELEDHSSNHTEKVGTNGTSEQECNNVSSGMLSQKQHHLTEEPPDVLGQNDSSGNPIEENVASDDDNHVRRGRSKLERWTSHKEKAYSNSSLQSLTPSSREANNDDMAQPVALIKTEDNAILDLDIKGAEAAQLLDPTGKESDRHLDTVAKLKKRSERFKLPMPGDKETATTKKADNEISLIKNETVADTDIKQERPARKRRWSSS